MTLLAWIQGLLAAVISAVSTSILASGVSSASGSPLNWSQIGSIAASSALVGACLFLKQSPLPTAPEALEIPLRNFPGNSVPMPPAPPKIVPTVDKIDP